MMHQGVFYGRVGCHFRHPKQGIGELSFQADQLLQLSDVHVLESRDLHGCSFQLLPVTKYPVGPWNDGSRAHMNSTRRNWRSSTMTADMNDCRYERENLRARADLERDHRSGMWLWNIRGGRSWRHSSRP